ncbi:hypothetical protein CLCR_01753 [Cladophialophora carrionii]|uniref:Uncharacterized protein n=1 Tax=Cladophialophora carrionii TaxID=86049 RepID=A0A1C1CAV3_9EURO|nr:hypothetical protein CLCR_01753 [Cladophialophora carrionii]
MWQYEYNRRYRVGPQPTDVAIVSPVRSPDPNLSLVEKTGEPELDSSTRELFLVEGFAHRSPEALDLVAGGSSRAPAKDKVDHRDIGAICVEGTLVALLEVAA